MKKNVFCIAALWMVLTAFAWFGPAKEASDAERRPLAQFPQITLDNVLNGKFMASFEDYTLDQFPLRDGFRQVKALFHTYVLGQQDTNNIYIYDGYGAKMEYPLQESSITHAINRFQYIKETYLADARVFMVIVPDKGYYLAPESGHLMLDYDRLYARIQEGMPWAEHIDLRGALKLSDYYRTDTHWRQEQLLPTAGVICSALGVTAPAQEDFTPMTLDRPFYGVYYGQAALPMEPEPMVILESPMLSGCRVYDHETGKTFPIYDLSKLDSRDLYDVYLGGAKALLTIENPDAKTDRELIVFRDSFGSSMIPLLVADYAKVTVVDIRYVDSKLLGQFIDFSGQDVLMLYSTLILNNSSAMK